MRLQNWILRIQVWLWNFQFEISSQWDLGKQCHYHVLLQEPKKEAVKCELYILVETQSLFKFVLVPGPSTLADKAQGPFSVSSNKRETRTSKK